MRLGTSKTGSRPAVRTWIASEKRVEDQKVKATPPPMLR